MYCSFVNYSLPLTWSIRCQPPTICSVEQNVVRKRSLPTYRERKYLEDQNIHRSKGRAVTCDRRSSFSLMVWPLVQEDDEDFLEQFRPEEELNQREIITSADRKLLPSETNKNFLTETQDTVKLSFRIKHKINTLTEIPPWAYVVRIRVPKAILGKRAVQRNRARRKIRAAAQEILPQYAKRKKEYVFSATPESLTLPHSYIVREIISSLKRSGCWEENITLEMIRRTKYCK